MSEIFDLSTLTRVRAREDMHVVVPFPVSETSTASSDPSFGTQGDTGVCSPLIKKLCDALNSQQISYCHWKSNWRLDRWLRGEGDLDRLVDRSDAQRFAAIIHGLGFKQAEPPADRQVPGILNFYGFDSEISRFIHLHVHYQLVIGNDLTKNYHLPIENCYLENSIRPGLISVPTPEFEFILFVLRMTLKHSVMEVLARVIVGGSKATSAIADELDQLEARVDRAQVANLLPQVAPDIDPSFFYRCVQSLRSGTSTWTRMRIRRQLERRLKRCARHPHTVDALLKIFRPVTRFVREQLFRQSPAKRFVSGGLLVAVVGGDGAGKTTVVRELNNWLGKKFLVRPFHIGKPPRSLITYCFIVMMRLLRMVGASSHPDQYLQQDSTVFPGYLQLLRWVSAGRDRCRVYTRMRRFATNGGVVLCDRHPIPQVRLMDGPNIADTVPLEKRNALVKRLMRAEQSYYRKIMMPDLLIVLRVDPDIAVSRKTNETELHVRTRSTELWEQDWTGTNAYVIDGGRPLTEVVSQAQSIIWSKL
jgi:thymidylate kinase